MRLLTLLKSVFHTFHLHVLMFINQIPSHTWAVTRYTTLQQFSKSACIITVFTITHSISHAVSPMPGKHVSPKRRRVSAYCVVFMYKRAEENLRIDDAEHFFSNHQHITAGILWVKTCVAHNNHSEFSTTLSCIRKWEPSYLKAQRWECPCPRTQTPGWETPLNSVEKHQNVREPKFYCDTELPQTNRHSKHTVGRSHWATPASNCIHGHRRFTSTHHPRTLTLSGLVHSFPLTVCMFESGLAAGSPGSVH